MPCRRHWRDRSALSRARAKAIILVCALVAFVSGARALLHIVTRDARTTSVTIDLALGGLVLGPAILARRTWARKLCLGLAWSLVLVPPVVVAVHGKFAYMGLGGTLGVLDLAHPDQPQLVGRSSLVAAETPMRAEVAAIAATQGRVFITTHDGDVFVFDTADPSRPHAIGGWEADDVGATTSLLAVSDRRLYAAGRTIGDGLAGRTQMRGRLSILDATSPATPTLLGHLELPLAPRVMWG